MIKHTKAASNKYKLFKRNLQANKSNDNLINLKTKIDKRNPVIEKNIHKIYRRTKITLFIFMAIFSLINFCYFIKLIFLENTESPETYLAVVFTILTLLIGNIIPRYFVFEIESYKQEIIKNNLKIKKSVRELINSMEAEINFLSSCAIFYCIFLLTIYIISNYLPSTVNVIIFITTLLVSIALALYFLGKYTFKISKFIFKKMN